MGELVILGWCLRHHQCRARGKVGPNAASALTGLFLGALSMGFEEDGVGAIQQGKCGLSTLNEMEADADERYLVGQTQVVGGEGLEAVWALAFPEAM